MAYFLVNLKILIIFEFWQKTVLFSELLYNEENTPNINDFLKLKVIYMKPFMLLLDLTFFCQDLLFWLSTNQLSY